VLGRPSGAGAEPPLSAPGRPARNAPTKTNQPRTPAGSEWLGVEAARADASTPILGAPEHPTGAVSGLEEVPVALRGRVSGPVPGGSRRGTVPPELTRRATRPAEPAQTGAEDGEQILTDEAAFSVETPGGEVIAGRPEDRGHRAEPRPTLGG
jgi:hypothetical protein